MGEITDISWCNHTFNPWWGCEKVSPACDNCYAESTSARYGFKIWGQDAERRFFGDKHWAEPLKWNLAATKQGVRKRVFCASMSDVMEDRKELSPWRLKLSRLIEETPQLDWLLLTKRPAHFSSPCFVKFDGFKNTWGMTTVENQECTIRARLLAESNFSVRGLSVEPMLGSVHLPRDITDKIHWVIVGSESGPKARPMNLDWARQLREQCREFGIAFFVKQLHVDGKLTKDISKFPEDLQIQEFPK